MCRAAHCDVPRGTFDVRVVARRVKRLRNNSLRGGAEFLEIF
jgi:hypothetical protein